MSENVWNFEQSVNVVEMTSNNYKKIFEKLENEKYDELEINKISLNRFLKEIKADKTPEVKENYLDMLNKGRIEEKIIINIDSKYLKWDLWVRWAVLIETEKQKLEREEQEKIDSFKRDFIERWGSVKKWDGKNVIIANIYWSYDFHINWRDKDKELNLINILSSVPIKIDWKEKININDFCWFLYKKEVEVEWTEQETILNIGQTHIGELDIEGIKKLKLFQNTSISNKFSIDNFWAELEIEWAIDAEEVYVTNVKMEKINSDLFRKEVKKIRFIKSNLWEIDLSLNNYELEFVWWNIWNIILINHIYDIKETNQKIKLSSFDINPGKKVVILGSRGSGIILKNLKIQEKGSILIENWKIDSLSMENCSFQEWEFKMKETVVKKSFKINDVNFGKSLLNTVDLSEAKKDIKLPILKDAILNNIDFWDLDSTKWVDSDERWEKKIYRKDTFRQIKHVLDSNSNFIEANKFYEKEMEAQLEESEGFEKLVLLFQKIVCRFWNSPSDAVLSLVILMLSAILVCQLYMISEIWYIDFDELKKFSIWLFLPINMYTISEKNILELAWTTMYFILYVMINYLLIITLRRTSRRA